MRSILNGLLVSFVLGSTISFGTELCGDILKPENKRLPAAVDSAETLIEALKIESSIRVDLPSLPTETKRTNTNVVEYQKTLFESLIQEVDSRSNRGWRPPIAERVHVRARR
ncbi:MAG: hypothetical protein AAF202_10675, partial [Pseudomonadota bacterium]